MDENLDRMRAAYGRHALELVTPLLDVLIVAREAYGGDIDTLLILLSVGVRQAEHGACRGVGFDDVRHAALATQAGSGTNVRSIAESTGIPRETVRRKVDVLEQAGLLQRIHNELFCTPLSFEGFADVRESIVRLAARNRRTVEAMLAPGPAAEPLGAVV
jgi:hypothetical protein